MKYYLPKQAWVCSHKSILKKHFQEKNNSSGPFSFCVVQKKRPTYKQEPPCYSLQFAVPKEGVFWTVM